MLLPIAWIVLLAATIILILVRRKTMTGSIRSLMLLCVAFLVFDLVVGLVSTFTH